MATLEVRVQTLKSKLCASQVTIQVLNNQIGELWHGMDRVFSIFDAMMQALHGCCPLQPLIDTSANASNVDEPLSGNKDSQSNMLTVNHDSLNALFSHSVGDTD